VNIDLPDLDWEQHRWTEAGQVEKIREEFAEVMGAVQERSPVNIVREALDLMQTCVTLINMQVEEFSMDLDIFVAEHKAKLISKGYLEDEDAPYAGHEEVE
jgi:phosphoribosyl-ATP pyrophosphohydrolase